MDAVPTSVSRAKLIKLLYDIAVSLGITFSFGQRVVKYFDDVDGSAAGVFTASGARHKAELVVAADGVGSKSSKLILGNDSRPKSSGFAVYRVAFPTAIAHRDKEVSNNFPAPTDGSDDSRIYLGPNTHAITIVFQEITTWLLTHGDKGHAADS